MANDQPGPSDNAETNRTLTDTAAGVAAVAVTAAVVTAPAGVVVAVGGLAGIGAAQVARRMGVPVDRATALAARHTAKAANKAARMSGRFVSKAADTMRDVVKDDAVYADSEDNGQPSRPADS